MSHITGESLVRQNYHHEAEELINQLISIALNTCHTSAQIAYNFEKDNVALYGFSQLFKFLCNQGILCTQGLSNYQVKRGGKVTLTNIEQPEKLEWNPLEALEYVLNQKKSINEVFLKCHKIAINQNDANLEDFVEHFMRHLVVLIQKLGYYVVKCRRVMQDQNLSGLGLYLFDMDLIRENLFSFDKYSITYPLGLNIEPTIQNIPVLQSLNQLLFPFSKMF
jgi:ferritin